MSEKLELELLGLPPTVNHMYRTGYRSRYKTLEVREYQQYAVNKLREAWQGRKALSGRIEMRLIFTTDNRHRWDIDNRVKALQDCLSIAGVIQDDSQLDALHVERCYGNGQNTKMIVSEIGIELTDKHQKHSKHGRKILVKRERKRYRTDTDARIEEERNHPNG